MKRLIATSVVAVGLVLGMAAPASAHHTHSPSTLCSQYRPSGYSLVQAHSHYYSNEHPAAAHCYYRNNATFATYTVCRWYSSHAQTFGTICAH